MIAEILGWLLLPVKWLIVGFFRVLGCLYVIVLLAFCPPYNLLVLILIVLLEIIFKELPPLPYH